jgi:ABC-type lipoprotein export system ATPase subunit
MPLLEIVDLKKSYRAPDGQLQPVLDVPSLTVEAGEQVALAGRSGSGKTTLLNAIAGILTPDSGSILLDGTDLTRLSEAQRDTLRAQTLGYVFQTFNLLQGYTALENVLLGMAFGPGPDRGFARELLERLGLADRMHHRPRQLSVGQQQRVALARALANRPRLVLADEPTGNLDPTRAQGALELMRTLCREVGAALLLVSHDEAVLGAFERRLDLAEINRAASTAEAGS